MVNITTEKVTSTSNLASSLLAVQKEATTLQKDSINPHFKNKYIGLDTLVEQVLPLLNKHDLVLTQFPTSLPVVLGSPVVGDRLPALRTTLTHAPTGEKIEDTMLLVLDKDNPQGQGSAITYARRYSLMAILSLVADVDDDGEKASKRTVLRSAPQTGRATADESAVF